MAPQEFYLLSHQSPHLNERGDYWQAMDIEIYTSYSITAVLLAILLTFTGLLIPTPIEVTNVILRIPIGFFTRKSFIHYKGIKSVQVLLASYFIYNFSFYIIYKVDFLSSLLAPISLPNIDSLSQVDVLKQALYVHEGHQCKLAANYLLEHVKIFNIKHFIYS